MLSLINSDQPNWSASGSSPFEFNSFCLKIMFLWFLFLNLIIILSFFFILWQASRSSGLTLVSVKDSSLQTFSSRSTLFIGPRPWLEGSYKIGSVHQSFYLSISFLGIGSLVFFWILAWFSGPIYSCVLQSWIFWKKFPPGKNDQKRSKLVQKTWFLDFLGKLYHYFCLEFVLNESSYGSLTFCENCMLGKNLVLKL